MYKTRKKVAIVVAGRANYASIRSVMKEILKYPDEFELQLFVGSSAILGKYGDLIDLIEQDGFKITEKFHMLVEGNTPVTMTMSVGMGLVSLSHLFSNHKPDLVITVGDRFETMAVAIAASFANIHLAHTMGGEITGTIDESIRHAVSKLAHFHFVSNQDAAERVIRLGEPVEYVFNVGCPRIDEIKRIVEEYRAHRAAGKGIYEKYKGVGVPFAIQEGKFLLVSQHPVTTEYGKNREHVRETLLALEELNMPTFMLWPNPDAGSEEVSKEIRTFREKKNPKWLYMFRNLPFEDYIHLMDICGCIVGNSSSAIREGEIIGVPTVNIGTRQQGRIRGDNVVDVPYEKEAIKMAIKEQLKQGKYKTKHVYGDGRAGERIVQKIRELDLKTIQVQKRIRY